MSTKKFSEALGNVDSKYIDRAMNYQVIKKKNNKWFYYVSMAACLCVVVSGVGFAVFNAPSRNIPDSDMSTESSGYSAYAAETTEITTVAGIAENKPLYYSELTGHSNAPKLEGSGFTSELSILPFDESQLKDCTAIIEGEITEIYVKDYEFSTACDKFEPDGTLNYKISSVVYKIKAENVLSGDFQTGDIITVEDEIFMFDSVISIRQGGRYVIPISNAGNEIYVHEDIVSGSNKRESIYATAYQFQPQIEAVDGGYIVPETWKTLVAEDCTNIIMDVTPENDSYLYDKMYFVADDVFDVQMSKLLESIKRDDAADTQ